jgi:hypothetical protein
VKINVYVPYLYITYFWNQCYSCTNVWNMEKINNYKNTSFSPFIRKHNTEKLKSASPLYHTISLSLRL